MTKMEIAQEIINQTGAPKKVVDKAIEEILSLAKDSLAEGKTVTIKKFGKFDVREKRARMGRNPRTGEPAEITARRVVRFKSGKFIRNVVGSKDS